MSCRKCGRDLEGLLACKYCAKVASALQEKRTNERYERDRYSRILRGVTDVWVQDCTCAGEPKVQHLAFQCWMKYQSFAFCGHNISLGKCHGMGGCQFWKPEYKDDPDVCPLCLDRLLNLGGGVCAEVCGVCGSPDGRHLPKCGLRKLMDRKTLARLDPGPAGGVQ